ncbi:MAG: GNAT family N-acetyltransferase [Halioglobus sp.]|nr:GNAT family N-acetyltransferase [Halioglobus sp.]
MNFTPVDATNTDQAIRVIAEAFADDPVINWTCNHPPSVQPFFEITLPVLIPHRLTYLDPQGRGAASWLGPDQKLNWPVTLSNVVKIMKLGGLKGVYRMLLSGAKTEKYHPKTPHYYLFAIGVTPGNKGRGLGTALIKPLLQRCDMEGIPAYLENSKAENLPFYEGHGFKVLQQIRFAASAPPVWLMWREPHSDANADTTAGTHGS